jgi:hypothetical protein
VVSSCWPKPLNTLAAYERMKERSSGSVDERGGRTELKKPKWCYALWTWAVGQARAKGESAEVGFRTLGGDWNICVVENCREGLTLHSCSLSASSYDGSQEVPERVYGIRRRLR